MLQPGCIAICLRSRLSREASKRWEDRHKEHEGRQQAPDARYKPEHNGQRDLKSLGLEPHKKEFVLMFISFYVYTMDSL